MTLISVKGSGVPSVSPLDSRNKEVTTQTVRSSQVVTREIADLEKELEESRKISVAMCPQLRGATSIVSTKQFKDRHDRLRRLQEELGWLEEIERS
jgi:hypothetical protein